MEENERRLKALGAGEGQLERELEILREVFANPTERIEFESRRLYLDDMNRVVAEGQGTLVEYDLVRAKRADGVLERAFLPVRVSRALPAESGLRLDQAAILLG